MHKLVDFVSFSYAFFHLFYICFALAIQFDCSLDFFGNSCLFRCPHMFLGQTRYKNVNRHFINFTDVSETPENRFTQITEQKLNKAPIQRKKTKVTQKKFLF